MLVTPLPSLGAARKSRRIVRLVLVTVLLGAGITVALRSRAPRSGTIPPGLPEALRGELVLRDQKLFRGAETQAFTGWMIERYPGGTYKSRSAVQAGRLDGVSEGWTAHGVLQVREQFRQGIAHGLRTKWYANGIKRSEATIENGKVTGIFRRWYEDGTLAEEAEIDRDIPHGVSRAFYPGGAAKSEVVLDQGEIRSQCYWPDPEAHPAMAAARAR